MPSVFVSAWVGAGNLGDELLLRRLLERLDGAGAGADEVTVVSLDPGGTADLHGVAAIDPRDLLGTIRALRRADLLVVGPGGLLQDHSSPFNLPYQLHRALIARLTRTPILGVGLGADPMNRRGSGALLRASLGRATAVAVRDDASRLALATHRVDAITTADLAVATRSPTAATYSDTIVVSLRPWRTGGRVPVRWQTHELAAEQVEGTARALDTIATTHGVDIRFVAFEPHTDHPLHEAIATTMTTPARCVVPELDELVDLVADSRAVVATRFHAGIVALVAQRPLTLIGYAPKVDALAGSLTGAATTIADDTDGLGRLPDAVTDALRADPAGLARGLRDAREHERANVPLLERALAR